MTNDDKLAEKARRLKDLAHSKERRFLHTELGYNFRMTNIQAALGLAQLEKIEEFIKIKQSMADLYSKLLKDVPGIKLPIQKEWARNVYWMYNILVEPQKFGINRNELMNKLEREGVETRSYFIPMHKQPVFEKMGFLKKECYPIADELSQKGMYLPSGLAITKEQIEMVAKKIKKIKKKI